ncbi:DUF2388 domain-containing protein [Bdellovibrio sp. HCB290]|uniref:DUF2388 domain-containing protein n=1 Tax=Bdellovibrio sp. HCB290 TaxID=3394356 RepID=UPI0039B65A02
MKSILFVLVTALSMNAMAIEITTTVKLSQHNAEESEYNKIMDAAVDDAAMFIATDGAVVGLNLTRAIETARYVNRTTATDMAIAEAILERKK